MFFMFAIRKSAFTLVELIIVILIIGILAAALIPRFNWVQARARDTARTTDLRNVSIAIQTYKVDNWTYPTANYLAAVPQKGVFSDLMAPSVFAQTVGSSLNTLDWPLSSYLSSIPRDPSGKGVKSAQGTNNCVEEWSSYAYASNGIWYAITAKSESGKGNASSCGDTIDRIDNGWYKKEGEWLITYIRTDVNYPDPSKWTPSYNFAFNNGTITDYIWPNGVDVIIPYEINWITVTNIGFQAFYANLLKSVSIPSWVKRIDDRAFLSNRLTELVIPENIEYIWSYTFASNLIKSLTIPNSLQGLGSAAFWRNKISSLTINGLSIIPSWAFKENPILNLTLNNTTTVIGEEAFRTTYTIKSLIIPDWVTTIGRAAFESHEIESLVIPNSVQDIGYLAFNSGKIRQLTIGNSVKSIGGLAFRANMLTTVELPNSIKTIWDEAFDANYITSITIPSSVTSIWPNAFRRNWPNRNSIDNIPRSPITAAHGTRNVVGTSWVKQL